MRKPLATTLCAALIAVLAVPAFANQGECPTGYSNIDYSGSLSWTADADYETVILVGGPPNDNNQDPDGRNKTFHNVSEGQTISREFHNISHICVLGGTPSTSSTTTTTAPESSTTSTTDPSTTSTSVPLTTTTVPGTGTTPPHHFAVLYVYDEPCSDDDCGYAALDGPPT